VKIIDSEVLLECSRISDVCSRKCVVLALTYGVASSAVKCQMEILSDVECVERLGMGDYQWVFQKRWKELRKSYEINRKLRFVIYGKE
jgi:hypothetical protein